MIPGANPYENAASNFQQAGDIWSSLGADGALQNVNDYINPYYNQVLDAAIGRMDRTYQQTNNQIGDQAQMAGAFGGSRHGVMEGVLAGEHAMNVGDLTARTAADAYNFGTNAAFNDANLMNSAAGNLTQLGQTQYGIGNDIADRQMQQGTMQQQLLQSILSGSDAAFQGSMNTPFQLIDMFNAIVSSDPRANSAQVTQRSKPGLFDFLSLGLQAAGSAGPWGADGAFG